MVLNDITIGEAREIAAMFDSNKSADSPYTIGDVWFFRTVTHHLIGKIKAVGSHEIVLKGGTVMWVADDGRFSELFANGPKEAEVYGDQDVVVGRGSIIDGTRLRVKIEVVTR